MFGASPGEKAVVNRVVVYAGNSIVCRKVLWSVRTRVPFGSAPRSTAADPAGVTRVRDTNTDASSCASALAGVGAALSGLPRSGIPLSAESSALAIPGGVGRRLRFLLRARVRWQCRHPARPQDSHLRSPGICRTLLYPTHFPSNS